MASIADTPVRANGIPAALLVVALATLGIAFNLWRTTTEARKWGACLADVERLCRQTPPSGNYTLNRVRCLATHEVRLATACRDQLLIHRWLGG